MNTIFHLLKKFIWDSTLAFKDKALKSMQQQFLVLFAYLDKMETSFTEL